MRLFFYFTLHSFWNQLKKIFKSWVLIFILACALLGGLIGFGAAKLSEVAEADNEEPAIEEVEEEHTLESELGIERDAAIELISGLVVLGIFTFNLLSADKNGGKIFLPADVPLLFASPMAPQSVLLFRLGTQLGTAVLFGLWLLFQLPNMILNFGMSLGAALSVIVALALTVAVGKLLQVLLYMLCTRYEKLRQTFRYWIYAFLGVLLAVFLLRFRGSESGWAAAAAGLFNGSISRLIPLWGWIKSFAVFAIAGNWGLASAAFVTVLVGIAALIYVIYHIQADFYEDAMAKSEETAETLRRAQGEETAVAMGKRKKDRSEKLRRDGLRHGSGANMFFFRTVYNRFRFAHFGFLTKTLEVYLLAAVGVTLFCTRALQTDPFYPVVLTLAGISFFRSLGDNLSSDVKLDFFLLIPESTEKKLFFSLLGNAFDCLLDLLPAMAVTVAAGSSPLRALVWMLLIVSVDFYGSTVSSFLDVSTPENAGRIAKSLIQVMFVYFGLIPDALLMALGLILERMVPAVIGSVAVNMLLGVVFLSLIPRYVDPPMDTPKSALRPFSGDEKEARKRFSRVGLSVFEFLGFGSLLQIGVLKLLTVLAPKLLLSETTVWLSTFAPLYLVAFPLALLLMGKAPEEKLQRRPLGLGGTLNAVIISLSMMYVGNLIGVLVTSVLSELSGKPSVNPVMGLISMDSQWLRILFVVVIAPLVEEFVFRRSIIDRLHPYGQKRAVFVSALLFGLFHGNLSQFFYAFLLGLVFGTVYVKTGRLRCSVGLHMLINFLGSVLAPALLERVDTQALGSLSTENLAQVLTNDMVLYFAYVAFMLLAAVLGLILMLVRRKELRFASEPLELRGREARRITWGNTGMLLNLLLSLGFIAYFTFLNA